VLLSLLGGFSEWETDFRKKDERCVRLRAIIGIGPHHRSH
jgi:hypothetical protein